MNSSNSNTGKKIYIPYQVRASSEKMKSNDLLEDFDENEENEEVEEEEESSDEESDVQPSEIVGSKPSDMDLTNVRDDIGYFADLCSRSTKLSSEEKKVYNKLINMIYITCEVIAADVVYKKHKTKGFVVDVYAAEAMDSVISNIRLREDTYSYQRFFALLPGQTVPLEVVQKYQSESKSKKYLESFRKAYKAEFKDSRRDEEQLVKANYGHRVLAAAHSTRQFISSHIKNHFKQPTELPSGESPTTHLYKVRRAVFEGTKPGKVKKAVRNAVDYRVANLEVIEIEDDDVEDNEENQQKKKKAKIYVDRAIVKEEVEEIRKKKVNEKAFSEEWYPKEWLAFLLTAQPAAEQALQFMVPYDPKEVALRNQGEWTPSVVHPIKKEDYTSSDNKNSLTSVRSPLSSKSEVKAHTHSHTHVFKKEIIEEPDIIEKKRKTMEANLEERTWANYFQNITRLEKAIAIAEKTKNEKAIEELNIELLNELKRDPRK